MQDRMMSDAVDGYVLFARSKAVSLATTSQTLGKEAEYPPLSLHASEPMVCWREDLIRILLGYLA